MKLFSRHEQGPGEELLSEEALRSAVTAALEEDAAFVPESAGTAPHPKALKKAPLTCRTGAKVAAFLLAVLLAGVTALSALGAVVMVDEGIYATPQWDYRNETFTNLTVGDGWTLIQYLCTGEKPAKEDAVRYLGGHNIASVEMSMTGETLDYWSYTAGGVTPEGTEYTHTWYHVREQGSQESWYSYDQPRNQPKFQTLGTVTVTIRLAKTLDQQDDYFWADRLISAAYALRYAIYGILAAAAVGFVVCFVFLLRASGRRPGFAAAQPGWGTRVPLDLLTAAVGLAGFLMAELWYEGLLYASDGVKLLGFLPTVAAMTALALGWCMSLALRLKLGGWWRNTVLYHAARLVWRLLRRLGKGLRTAGHGAAALVGSIPLVWKTAAVLAALAAVEFCVLLCACCELDVLLIFWGCKSLILIPAALFIALMLRRLQRGGEALAAGDLSYQVDTKRLIWDFRRHGENLNRVGEGMTAAVEQRLRSERMKTELITNVSHDIKTPLTSVINYADLIGKEPCDNPTITEYAGVLHRQSERLKRLIDDLVEASKASTGNLEVIMAPCEVGVLLTQTAGEYEQRLKDRGLELVTRQPDRPVKILADGRRLWRVFDNLMGNICKYAQGGTRVYLMLEETADTAVISFKNTSREPLDLTAEELMERFVRGDHARKSEGSGLGLSIAKSLTELQNGSLELTVDGDLFKVLLRFPTIS